MEIRRLDRASLGAENNHSQRLLPWHPLNAPFEGAWNVIRPGTSSVKHAHHEYEIFIAVSGQAILESADQRAEFRPGDIVLFPPHVDHQVINETGENFEMYSVWWDSEMTERFARRHESGRSHE